MVKDHSLRRLLKEIKKPLTKRDVARSLVKLTAELKVYEDKYGMTVEELRAGLTSGKIKETFGHCCWLMLADHVERCKETLVTIGRTNYKH